MKIGSLCSGYGGLDMAVEAFYEAETVWMSDIDKASCLAIEQRWGLPNLGNLKEIDWDTVEPVDILTAGYPCQPFSSAGHRKGANDPRHLWPSIKEIISRIRPGIVVLENVRGHLSLGFKEVLQDLTQIGYDAKWQIVRASDVGAPHRRERLFIVAYPNIISRGISSSNERTIIAYPNSSSFLQSRRANRPIPSPRSQIINWSDRQESRSSSSIATDSNDFGCASGKSGGFETELSAIKGITSISNPNTKQLQADRQTSKLGWRFETPLELSMRKTPNPLDQSKLNPKFVEYMMGLPEGWVTDLPISRAQQFKLLGNGVVPQQAYKALEILEMPSEQDFYENA
jgi:DNA (cytosine-5)-methyltransferase 1